MYHGKGEAGAQCTLLTMPFRSLSEPWAVFPGLVQARNKIKKSTVAYRAGGQIISSMSLVGCYEESKSNFQTFIYSDKKQIRIKMAQVHQCKSVQVLKGQWKIVATLANQQLVRGCNVIYYLLLCYSIKFQMFQCLFIGQMLLQ